MVALAFSPSTSVSVLVPYNFKVYCKTSEANVSTKKLPPGPRKLPVIGNLHNMLGSLPHHILKDMATEHGPLMHLQLGELSTIVVSSTKMAQEVLKTKDHVFSQRAEILASKIMLYDNTDVVFSNGEYWKQMRKLCSTELLGARKVKSLAPIREDEVSKLVESIRLASISPINLTEKITWMTSVIACRAAFGNRLEDQNQIISIAKEAITLSGGFDLAELYPSLGFLHFFSTNKSRLLALHEQMDRIFDRIINDRKAELLIGKGTTEDAVLIDVLLRLQGSGDLGCPFTTNNVKAVIWDMFVAGTDSSSTTIEWAMAEMIRNPETMSKAQSEIRQSLKGKKTICEEDIQELEYLKLIIKETLRLHPPATLLLPRESTERCEIDGYEIPEKTRLIINAWAIGRDPNYWLDHESFIPERFIDSSADYTGTNFKFIPFGAGRRICPGILFGMAGIELCLAKLLYHFDWKLPHGIAPENLDMTETFGAAVGRKNNLYLIASPYMPTE